MQLEARVHQRHECDDIFGVVFVPTPKLTQRLELDSLGCYLVLVEVPHVGDAECLASAVLNDVPSAMPKRTRLTVAPACVSPYRSALYSRWQTMLFENGPMAMTSAYSPTGILPAPAQRLSVHPRRSVANGFALLLPPAPSSRQTNSGPTRSSGSFE